MSFCPSDVGVPGGSWKEVQGPPGCYGILLEIKKDSDKTKKNKNEGSGSIKNSSREVEARKQHQTEDNSNILRSRPKDNKDRVTRRTRNVKRNRRRNRRGQKGNAKEGNQPEIVGKP
ncbi:hypothetical protein RUM43_008151 [Polyplax serrata]|uniref:Uncharacterized protein n=1 Tax=Polyplax serrata TaxID=468196 RepID=A0AAN8PND1_POLSC